MNDAGELVVRRALSGTQHVQHGDGEDVPEGQEPGAGRGIMLVQTDSYDDIAAFLQTPADSDVTTRPAVPRRVSKPDVSPEKNGELEDSGSGNKEKDDADSESGDSIIEHVDANIHRNTTIASFGDDDNSVIEEMTMPDESPGPDDVLTLKMSNHDLSVNKSVSQSSSDSSPITPSTDKAESSITTPSTAPQSPSRARAMPPLIQSQISVTSEAGEEESCIQESWRRHRKHIFILSSAGKPIYTRYGDEADQASIIGVLQALFMSYEHSEDRERDSLVSIMAGGHRFVFLYREPLILVCVSSGAEPIQQLKHQLLYAYFQIVFVLNAKRIDDFFRQRTNYDLRRQLTGMDRFTNTLMDSCDTDTSFLVSAVRCLALEGSVRDTIAQTIAQNCKIHNLVFAILFAVDPDSDTSVPNQSSNISGTSNTKQKAGAQLITIVRHRNYYLHPMELHLLFNLVSETGAFKGAENWVPVCLPKFNPTGFLHAYVSYLDPASTICIILLTTEIEGFSRMSQAKQVIEHKLTQQKCLDAISASIRRGLYSIKSVGVPEMRHFVYKSRTASLCTSPLLAPPYLNTADQSRLISLYRYVHHHTHLPHNSGSTPVRMLLVKGPLESCVAWITGGFEVYAIFGPLVSKTEAVGSVNKLMRWIKKEEDKLFILNSLTIAAV